MFNIYYTIREGLCSQRIVFIYFTLCTLSKDQPMEGKYMLKNITSCSRDHRVRSHKYFSVIFALSNALILALYVAIC